MDVVPDELLAVLQCPADQRPLRHATETALTCTSCGANYPVLDGIPVMLTDHPSGARP